MRHAQNLYQQSRSVTNRHLFFVLIAIAAAALAATAVAQQSPGAKPDQRVIIPGAQLHENPMARDLETKYPGLIEELGRLEMRMVNEVHLPPTRTQSRLLPLLPENTVGLVSLPNYGDALHQALMIFQQELKSSAPLRDWWSHADLGGAKTEDSLNKLYQLMQFLGDEIVISGNGSGNKGHDPSLLLVAEVKKPGLKPLLQQLSSEIGAKPGSELRVFDPQQLAAATDSHPGQEPLVLLRPELVAISFDLGTLRAFNSQLERHGAGFIGNDFGQRLTQSYQNGGVGVLAGIDVRKIISETPVEPGVEKARASLQASGFADINYAVWEHKEVAGQPASQGEITFNGPRHGIASWLGSPAPLGGLDFISPKAGMIWAFVLKSPPQILDDLQELSGSSGGASPMAMLGMMEQQFNINLKDDILNKLTGEIVVELQPPADQKGSANWKAILRVNDADGLQQTLNKLLQATQVPVTPHRETGFTYNSVQVPSGGTTNEIAYAFVDNYLIVGPSAASLKESVRLHRSGESLLKSRDFLASLPAGHSPAASAMIYQNLSALMTSTWAQSSPMSQLVSGLFGGDKASATFAYGEPAAIRWVSNRGSGDVGFISMIAAIAIPKMVISRDKATESAAVSNLRTLNVAQVTYITSYPDQGYASSLAVLGSAARDCGTPSASHACLIDSTLGCDSIAGCVKSGYRFRLSALCKGSVCDDYVTSAVPLGTDRGGRSFCSTSDAIIRWKIKAPPNGPVSARECRTWEPMR